MMAVQIQPLVASYKDHLWVNSAEEKKWELKIGSCSRFSVDWRSEIVFAASQIWQMISKHKYMKATLYVDGSYASQIMVQAFHWAQVPFEVLVPRFSSDLNIHAVSTMVSLFEQERIQYKFYEFDFENYFHSEEAKNLAQNFSSNDPSQIVAMHLWDKNSFMIYPFGLPKLVKTNEGWKVQESESEYAILRFQQENKYLGVPCFFKWNPECVHAFLNDLHLRSVVMNITPASHFDDLQLREVLQRYFPLHGKKNWNGFEKLTFAVKKFQSHLNIKNDKYSFSYADYCHNLEPKQRHQPKAG